MGQCGEHWDGVAEREKQNVRTLGKIVVWHTEDACGRQNCLEQQHETCRASGTGSLEYVSAGLHYIGANVKWDLF